MKRIHTRSSARTLQPQRQPRFASHSPLVQLIVLAAATGFAAHAQEQPSEKGTPKQPPPPDQASRKPAAKAQREVVINGTVAVGDHNLYRALPIDVGSESLRPPGDPLRYTGPRPIVSESMSVTLTGGGIEPYVATWGSFDPRENGRAGVLGLDNGMHEQDLMVGARWRRGRITLDASGQFWFYPSKLLCSPTQTDACPADHVLAFDVAYQLPHHFSAGLDTRIKLDAQSPGFPRFSGSQAYIPWARYNFDVRGFHVTTGLEGAVANGWFGREGGQGASAHLHAGHSLGKSKDRTVFFDYVRSEPFGATKSLNGTTVTFGVTGQIRIPQKKP